MWFCVELAEVFMLYGHDHAELTGVDSFKQFRKWCLLPQPYPPFVICGDCRHSVNVGDVVRYSLQARWLRFQSRNCGSATTRSESRTCTVRTGNGARSRVTHPAELCTFWDLSCVTARHVQLAPEVCHTFFVRFSIILLYIVICRALRA
jgi:hypothetical protein